jgi:hypothetical protein
MKKRVLVTGIIGVLLALIITPAYPAPAKKAPAEKVRKLPKNAVIWDDTLTIEQGVELKLGYGQFTVTSYNGIDVDWKKGAVVFLPPGETVFTVVVNFSTASTRYTGESIFVWNFEAGGKFTLWPWAVDGKPGIYVTDMSVKHSYKEYYESPFFAFPEAEEEEKQRLILE